MTAKRWANLLFLSSLVAGCEEKRPDEEQAMAPTITNPVLVELDAKHRGTYIDITYSLTNGMSKPINSFDGDVDPNWAYVDIINDGKIWKIIFKRENIPDPCMDHSPRWVEDQRGWYRTVGPGETVFGSFRVILPLTRKMPWDERERQHRAGHRRWDEVPTEWEHDDITIESVELRTGWYFSDKGRPLGYDHEALSRVGWYENYQGRSTSAAQSVRWKGVHSFPKRMASPLKGRY